MKCEDCRYYTKWDRRRDKGSCVRYPPMPTHTTRGILTMWPEVHPLEACGEFKKRKSGETEIRGTTVFLHPDEGK